MLDQIDFGKISSELAQKYTKEFLIKLLDDSKAAATKWMVNIAPIYEEYLKSLYRSNSLIKTFIITEDPCSIFDFYIPLDLKSGQFELNCSVSEPSGRTELIA